MRDDDIVCGTCGKRNDANRVTCWSCKETLEEEADSSFSAKRTLINVTTVLALLAVAGLILPLAFSFISSVMRR